MVARIMRYFKSFGVDILGMSKNDLPYKMPIEIIPKKSLKSVSKLQVKILLTIHIRGVFGITLSEISEILKKDRSNIQRALNPLMNVGLVDKTFVPEIDKHDTKVKNLLSKNDKYTEKQRIESIARAYEMPHLKKKKDIITNKEKSKYYYVLTEDGESFAEFFLPYQIPKYDYSDL